MGSHTNVSIPNRYGQIESLMRQVEELEFKNKSLSQEVIWLENEMQNIVDAVLEWGFVDIEYRNGEKITLIKKPHQPGQGGAE